MKGRKGREMEGGRKKVLYSPLCKRGNFWRFERKERRKEREREGGRKKREKFNVI